MDSMADNLWLLAVSGGTMALGFALIYGVLTQRKLPDVEQAEQSEQVRSLYGRSSANTSGGRSRDGSDQQRSRTGSLVLAIILVIVGGAFGLYVTGQSTAPSPSVEGKKKQAAQPAGPADREALPGQR